MERLPALADIAADSRLIHSADGGDRMIVNAEMVEPMVALLTSDQTEDMEAEFEFMKWAEENHCYTPTASEMEEDDEGRWTVRVMRRPMSDLAVS
jgi:hypothetical protein